MNFLKLSYEATSGVVLSILFPFSLVENSLFTAVRPRPESDTWANTRITLPSGSSLLVIETTEEILAATNGLTTTVDAKTV